MADYAHKKTDELINKAAKKIKRDYRKANKECKEKLNKHLARFAEKDANMSAKLKAGEITAQEYSDWRLGQIATGQRWKDMCDTLAKDYTNADKIARASIEGHMAEAYALNRNFGMFQIEATTGIDTSFTLYNRHAVERIWRENPTLMIKPKLKTSKAFRWNRRHINTAVTQGILQGKPLKEIANGLDAVSGAGYRSALMAARTSMTSAQSAGRVDSYKEAEEKGIEMQQMWLATLDDHTRHSHAMMDGECVPVGEEFSNGCKFPADPDCPDPSEVYNCRCTLISQIKGFERDPSDLSWRNGDRLNEKSYDDWKKSKQKKKKTSNKAGE